MKNLASLPSKFSKLVEHRASKIRISNQSKPYTLAGPTKDTTSFIRPRHSMPGRCSGVGLSSLGVCFFLSLFTIQKLHTNCCCSVEKRRPRDGPTVVYADPVSYLFPAMPPSAHVSVLFSGLGCLTQPRQRQHERKRQNSGGNKREGKHTSGAEFVCMYLC